jgi:chromosome segregation ATPase
MAVQYLLEKAAEEAESGGEAAEIRELERTAAEAGAALEVRRGWIEERQAYLESLQQRMEVQKTEEGLVTQQLEEERRKVKEAEERLYWLQSPIHPANVWRWIRILRR